MSVDCMSGVFVYNQAAPTEPKEPERYFNDPQSLGFDPAEWNDETDQPEGDPPVTMRQIWADDLARLLWVAIKTRHLTDQHFRRKCLDAAQEMRERPPLSPLHLARYSIPSVASYSEGAHAFYRQLWPYIVRVLIDENKWGRMAEVFPSERLELLFLRKRCAWLERRLAGESDESLGEEPIAPTEFIPFLIPPRIPARQLRTVVYPRENRDEPHPYRDDLRNGYPYIGDTWRREIKCSFCYRSWYDPIHIEGPRLPK